MDEFPDTIITKDYQSYNDELSLLKMAHILHKLRIKYPKFLFEIYSISDVANSVTIFIRTCSGQNIGKYRLSTIKDYVSETIFKGNARTYEEFFQILDEKYKKYFK
jgi:hypothetical protein